MLRNFFVILTLASFSCFLYGIRNIFLEVEDNACSMTYMFEPPQYAKVRFKKNKLFPNYGIYYYYEGRNLQDVNKLTLKGAPVIFIPGNGGSYKQVRSLASVALRKAMNSRDNIHLNYFTLDFKEELSGLYGGYLEYQKKFVILCVEEILKFYKNSGKDQKNVVLIGHSMGGKVAQAVLEDASIIKYINTIIFISTPLDTPILNTDYAIDKFYVTQEDFLSVRRSRHLLRNTTNRCRHFKDTLNDVWKSPFKESEQYENVLMITIGGGNRDIIARDGLTISKFSDIHAMTSSIPYVWLSCDHLSAVWCLQLVLVINRFLFDIVRVDSTSNLYFINDKDYRLESGENYFVTPVNKYKASELSFNGHELWMKNAKLIGTKTFHKGLRQYTHFLLSILNHRNVQKLYIEIKGYAREDWLYACVMNTVDANKSKCSRGLPIFNYTRIMPSVDGQRSMSVIDIENLSLYHKNSSHIFVRLPPMEKKISLKIDSYNMEEREFYIKAIRWFNLNTITVVNETLYGGIYYHMLIRDLTESIYTLKFDITPSSCAGKHFEVLVKICVPWARGYHRYTSISEYTPDKSVYVNVPFNAPNNYNTTINPVSLEMYLDPVCRYKISYQFSIAATTSRIVRQFFHWLPAHLTCVLIIVLKCQLCKNHNSSKRNTLSKPFGKYFQCNSYYILAGGRLLKKILPALKILPLVNIRNSTTNSLHVPIVIHSTAIVLSIVLVFVVWAMIKTLGNVLHFITRTHFLRFTRISITMKYNTLVSRVWAISFGILFISIAWISCTGIALIFALIYYLVLLSNAYKETLKKTLESAQKGETYNQQQQEEQHREDHLTASKSVINTHQFDYSRGLYNFSFHITMFLLLLLMTLYNFGIILAWIKSVNINWSSESDNMPSIVVLLCLSLLLQLDAPQKCCNRRVMAFILYFSAMSCLVYCQENIYLLNYIIAFVYICITVLEFFKFL